MALQLWGKFPAAGMTRRGTNADSQERALNTETHEWSSRFSEKQWSQSKKKASRKLWKQRQLHVELERREQLS